VRLLALLLLAAILGFAVGRVTAREEGGRGGRGDPPKPGSAIPSADHAEPRAPKADAEPVAVRSACVPVPPTSRLVEELVFDGGALDVDFERFEGDRTVWLGSRGLNGGYEEMVQEYEEGITTFPDLSPGVYVVSWTDADGRRVGTHAKVEKGWVTMVRAADHRDPPPVPEGLGMLSVFVEAAEGGGLGAGVGVGAGLNQLNVWTNDAGHMSMPILPGRYKITVGEHRSEAVVEEGKTTFHRVTHEKEGDVVFLVTHPMDISLEPLGSEAQRALGNEWHGWPGWAGHVGGVGAEVAPYLPEGEYDVFLRYSLGVPLTRIAVHAGRATQLRCEPPGGGLLLHIVPACEYVDLRLWRIRDGEEGDSMTTRFSCTALEEPLMLLPGRYGLTVSADDREARSAEFEVSDSTVEVTLELPAVR
jgi:hypothetical protein